MKLTYWKAQCLDDDNAYSIRAKTLRECKALVGDDKRFDTPQKIVIEYENAFDLMRQLTGEGGGWA